MKDFLKNFLLGTLAAMVPVCLTYLVIYVMDKPVIFHIGYLMIGFVIGNTYYRFRRIGRELNRKETFWDALVTNMIAVFMFVIAISIFWLIKS